MIVDVDMPTAWCWLPLSDPIVIDPDIADNPPRYDNMPEGGWNAVGDAVISILVQVEEQRLDPMQLTTQVEIDVVLTGAQECIVGTWFSESMAPQCWSYDASWTNGRHRAWGLQTAGFEFAPIMLNSVSDAIYYWYPDPLGWPPLNAESIEDLRDELERWSCDPAALAWRSANPGYAGRWAEILDRWDVRLRNLA